MDTDLSDGDYYYILRSVDTSGNEFVQSGNLTGFDRFYTYDAGISLNTQIFR